MILKRPMNDPFKQFHLHFRAGKNKKRLERDALHHSLGSSSHRKETMLRKESKRQEN
jgi:hypothetical protein